MTHEAAILTAQILANLNGETMAIVSKSDNYEVIRWKSYDREGGYKFHEFFEPDLEYHKYCDEWGRDWFNYQSVVAYFLYRIMKPIVDEING